MHKLTTGDPKFNPAEPVEINGFVFIPLTPALSAHAAELRKGDHLWQADRYALADMIDPPRPTGWPAPAPQPDKPVPPVDWTGAREPHKRTGHRYVAPPRPGFAAGYTTCGTRREGDEKVCPACGLRWSVKKERPPCPK